MLFRSVEKGCFDENKSQIISLTVADDSLTTISDGAFQDYKNLKSVIIGNSVKNIGNSAFEGCEKLTKVIFHSPKNLDYAGVNLGTGAFKTGGNELTFYGDVNPNYAPFTWAMDKSNYMNPTTGKRVCYKTLAPSKLTILRDNETDLITLVDYPQFGNIDAENKELIDEMEAYYLGKRDQYTDETTKNELDKMLLKGYSIQDKYNAIYEDNINPIYEWQLLSTDEIALVDTTENIVIPAGIESIDVKKFMNSPKNSSNRAYLPSNKQELYGTDSVMDGVTITAGLFSGKIIDYPANDDRELLTQGNDRIKTVTMNTVKFLPEYAFDSCENLTSVILGSECSEVGTAPFRGCSNLTGVSENEYLKGENGILYSYNSDGSLNIIECLPARGLKVGEKRIDATNDPLISKVTSITPGAFQDCKNISRVDLSTATGLTAIPKNAFNNCSILGIVTLPESVKAIYDDAFTNTTSTLTVTIPGREVAITDNAFTHDSGTIITYENSAAYTYAKNNRIDVELIGNKFAVFLWIMMDRS